MPRLTFWSGSARREDVFSFACFVLGHGGMSNHRESSCFHIEKLQLHDVNLKAAELLMVASVVCVTAHLSEHNLPIYVHLSGINCGRVLCCVHCLRTGDPDLTWCVSDAGKPLVTLNFLIATSAPVFALKFLVRLSVHLLQGGPVHLNSWHSDWGFGREKLQLLLEASTHELLNFDTVQNIAVSVGKRQ